jgi:8-oxo-dGTP pyrophosphatase MutT (NUDIX family)
MAGRVAPLRKKEGALYGDDGLFLRVGCICIDRTGSKVGTCGSDLAATPLSSSQVLLVESSRRKEAWIVPSGKLEAEDESPEAGAVRETEEEAGALGVVVADLGDDFVNDVSMHRTRYYVMLVTELLPSHAYEEGRKGRRRRWVVATEARSIVKGKPGQIRALEAAFHSHDFSFDPSAVAVEGVEVASEEPAASISISTTTA